MAVALSRRDKVDKINAELARLEVEMELEEGGKSVVGGGGMRCKRFNHKSDGPYVGLDLFRKMMGYTKPDGKQADKGKVDALEASTNFENMVLRPTLSELAMLMHAENYSKTWEYVTSSQAFIESLIDVKDYFRGKAVPATIWKLSLKAPSDAQRADGKASEATFFIMLFTNAKQVEFKILRHVVGQKLHIDALPPIYAWSGKGKDHYYTVIGTLGGWIRQLFYKSEEDLKKM